MSEVVWRRSSLCGSKSAPGDAGILEEHYVGFGVRTQNAKGLAVGRELKHLNCVGLEIRDLASAGAVQRLEPEIFDAILANGINDGAPVGCELWTTRNSGVRLKRLYRGFWARIERDEHNLLHGIILLSSRCEKN